MLINIDKIDVRSKEEKHTEYINKRLNVNFLCRTIIEDENIKLENGFNEYINKNTSNNMIYCKNNIVKPKHRSKNKKGS